MSHSRNATTGDFGVSINRFKEIIHEEGKHASTRVDYGHLKELDPEIANDLEDLETIPG